MSNRKYRVAVIPGDGIGKEVIPEGQRAAEAVAASRWSGRTSTGPASAMPRPAA